MPQKLAGIVNILILIEITLLILSYMVGRYLYIKHPELYTTKDPYKGTIWNWFKKKNKEN